VRKRNSEGGHRGDDTLRDVDGIPLDIIANWEHGHALDCEIYAEIRLDELRAKVKRGERLTDDEAEELEVDEEHGRRLRKDREELERRIAAEGGWKPLNFRDGNGNPVSENFLDW
jgi:hypothetical protein